MWFSSCLLGRSLSPAELLKSSAGPPATGAAAKSGGTDHGSRSRGEQISGARSSSRLLEDESDDRPSRTPVPSSGSSITKNANQSAPPAPPPPPPLVISCVPSLGVNSSLLCRYRFGDLPFYPIKGKFKARVHATMRRRRAVSMGLDGQ